MISSPKLVWPPIPLITSRRQNAISFLHIYRFQPVPLWSWIVFDQRYYCDVWSIIWHARPWRWVQIPVVLVRKNWLMNEITSRFPVWYEVVHENNVRTDKHCYPSEISIYLIDTPVYINTHCLSSPDVIRCIFKLDYYDLFYFDYFVLSVVIF